MTKESKLADADYLLLLSKHQELEKKFEEAIKVFNGNFTQLRLIGILTNLLAHKIGITNEEFKAAVSDEYQKNTLRVNGESPDSGTDNGDSGREQSDILDGKINGDDSGRTGQPEATKPEAQVSDNAVGSGEIQLGDQE